MEGRIFISKDVVFNENDFPFKNGLRFGDHLGSTSQVHQAQFPNIVHLTQVYILKILIRHLLSLYHIQMTYNQTI